jgi:excisionase family DNA binding protein
MHDTKQAAKMIGVVPAQVRKLINMGVLACYRVGDKIVLSSQQVDDFLESCHRPIK